MAGTSPAAPQAPTSEGQDTVVAAGLVVPADHPGIPDLFAVLAYGEISAFYRLVEEAQSAPSLRSKVAVAKMAASEMGHFRTVEAALADRGFDVYDAMEPFVKPLDAYHASTNPSTWLESMVKFYVGDGIAADFYREIAGRLDPSVAAVVRDVLADTGSSEFVVEQVRAAVDGNRTERDRLALWGRRLLGEALTQAQLVIAAREQLTSLMLSATGNLNGIVALFERMQDSHAQRMATLGLA